MTKQLSHYNFRHNFGKINIIADLPNLIEVQRNSYERAFLQFDVDDTRRKNEGLQLVFSSVFPIQDAHDTATLEFIKYSFDKPKYDSDDCKKKGLSYAVPLKITVRLITWDIDADTKVREIKNIKEQQVYIGDIPLMTHHGTFIINGIEKVIVSQMHRSPGIFYDHDKGKTAGKLVYAAHIIPYRGSWLDIEFDAKDLMYARIDKKRKFYVTTLLRALGMNTQDILDFYYKRCVYAKKNDVWVTEFIPEVMSQKLTYPLINVDTGEVLLEVGQRLSLRVARKLQNDGLKNIVVPRDELIGKFVATSIHHDGKVIVAAGGEITESILEACALAGITEIEVLLIAPDYGPYIRNTLMSDKNTDHASSLIEIFKILRPGEPAAEESGLALLRGLFFNENRYDLSQVGRIKLNARLKLDLTSNILTVEDIKQAVKLLADLRDGNGHIDDIDHLGNRRVRSVGELMENQFRIALLKIAKSCVEKLNTEKDFAAPSDLINPRILPSQMKEFLVTSSFAQFMDQTNPLSEITHKRRLSALGPGGLNRERAGIEVRDVHPTHYGKICPIETPEGPNIGLINSLATYAHINKYGFIESPYRRVRDGYITDEVVYLSAVEESKYKIGQAGIKIDVDGKILEEQVITRYEENLIMCSPIDLDFVDVAPMQMVSVAAALIPFLENDDANRALMGSNMQRQAVPLLRPRAPIVGTGMEGIVAKDSGALVIATNDGVVEYVDATRIVVRGMDDGKQLVNIYSLIKFQHSNHNTCVNQRPLVSVGDVVHAGDVIADGHSMHNGEISLGGNVLVAFLSLDGLNFKDSILLSQRLAKYDVFTSIKLESLEIAARDTKLGPEEITRDIPNVADTQLKDLDESGVIRVGANVKPGDILVGKVTPRGETSTSPEEKLLRAIFGEKAADVVNSSLYVPPGISGTVEEVRIFCRRGIEKDARLLSIEKSEVESYAKDRDEELSIIEKFVLDRLRSLLAGQVVVSGPIRRGELISDEHVVNLSINQHWQIIVENHAIMESVREIKLYYDERKNDITYKFNDKVEKLQAGTELPQGVLKMVKVFIASKRKIQPGDKMAGRHGDKGVVSKIVPEEDMPFLEDGTPIDVVVTPLGVPSRMNVGQILETHLGLASFMLGRKIGAMIDEYQKTQSIDILSIKDFVKKIYKGKEAERIDSMPESDFIALCHQMKNGVMFASPVFDGAKVQDIKEMLNIAGLDESGQVTLFNGKTGEPFDKKVTVGIKYIFKLNHEVSDKMHARSVGPYSLVTQQPLGGRACFGGQRLGEMECWALEAYGASYTLLEMITVKSDDVEGRAKMYSSIVNGQSGLRTTLPESFNVAVNEIRSLGINIESLNLEALTEAS